MGKKNNIQKAAVKPRRKLVFFERFGKNGFGKTANFTETRLTRRVK